MGEIPLYFSAQHTGATPGEVQGTSPMRNSAPLGPYCRTMQRALWWVPGGGRFLMSETPL